MAVSPPEVTAVPAPPLWPPELGSASAPALPEPGFEGSDPEFRAEAPSRALLVFALAPPEPAQGLSLSLSPSLSLSLAGAVPGGSGGAAPSAGAQEVQEQPELQLELRGLPAFHHLLPACSGDPQIPAGCLEGAAQAGMEALAAPGSPSRCWGGCAVLGMLRAQLEALLVEKRGIFFRKAAFPP